MADAVPTSPSAMLDSLVDMVQKVGFPIVMVFILSYVIWIQNQTLIKVNVQQAANMTAFTTRMDALDKTMEEIKNTVRTGCVPKP